MLPCGQKTNSHPSWAFNLKWPQAVGPPATWQKQMQNPFWSNGFPTQASEKSHKVLTAMNPQFRKTTEHHRQETGEQRTNGDTYACYRHWNDRTQKVKWVCTTVKIYMGSDSITKRRLSAMTQQSERAPTETSRGETDGWGSWDCSKYGWQCQNEAWCQNQSTKMLHDLGHHCLSRPPFPHLHRRGHS